MNEMLIVGYLRYTCYFLTNEDIRFKTKKQQDDIKKIIELYFSKLDDKIIKMERIRIHENHIEVSFETTPSVNLTKFISNFKSVTSRFIKNSSDVWLRNYLVITEDNHLTHTQF